MQKVLLISGDSTQFCQLVAEALCDRFDRMLLIQVSDFKRFIYSGLQPDNQTQQIATQQRMIGIEGATATAAAALRAQYGVIIIDEFIGPDILSHYEYLFKENVIAELNLISLQPASSEPDNNQINVGEKIIQYHHEDQYLMIADLIQDLVGKGETIVTLSN